MIALLTKGSITKFSFSCLSFLHFLIAPIHCPARSNLLIRSEQYFLHPEIYTSGIILSFILSFIHLWSCRPNLSSSPHRRCVSVSVVRWRGRQASSSWRTSPTRRPKLSRRTQSIHKIQLAPMRPDEAKMDLA